MRGDAGDKVRLVPLVHQDEIRTLQDPIEIEPSRVIELRPAAAGRSRARLPGRPGRDPSTALGAPAIGRLQCQDIKTAVPALAQYPSQEMRVAHGSSPSARIGKTERFSVSCGLRLRLMEFRIMLR